MAVRERKKIVEWRSSGNLLIVCLLLSFVAVNKLTGIEPRTNFMLVTCAWNNGGKSPTHPFPDVVDNPFSRIQLLLRNC
jgi:hypothetical protein